LPQQDSIGLPGCPGSNNAEMFYMLAPDPGGSINGNTRTADYVRESTLSTTAHEFQHLINASRRIYVNDAFDLEESWLDEGLAHIAEELNFYANAPGTGPGENVSQQTIFRSNAILGTFNEYGIDNVGRFAEYLDAPPKWGPYADNDSLATRGAAWSFLRYAADRKGGNQQQLWFSLVNSRQSGLANIAAIFAIDPLAWVRDWTVANYTDDAVAGIAAQYTQPSWNFRDLFTNRGLGGVYPLATVPLTSGATQNLTIHSGSAAYLRFGVAGGSQAGVQLGVPGAAAPASCTPVALTVGQVYQAGPADASSLCVAGGSGGSEYVLIPFHASTALEAQLAVNVTASNVVPVTGGPSPSRSPAFSRSLAAVQTAADGFRTDDGGWERSLRLRERREFGARLHRGGTGARFQAAATSALSFSLVRTR
ncbi:MAG: hypothetical protein JO040_13665, partial [Gemmatimonadetes bacterium]|nr:hypothetical protein [Gemmatimonadota bacterium]